MLERTRELRDGLDETGGAVPSEEVAEAGALLAWLADGHFLFLGYREYTLMHAGEDVALVPVDGTGLGILRRTGQQRSGAFARLPQRIRSIAHLPRTLTLTKSNARSTVHRPVPMDYIGVKRFDEQGRVIGERRLLGLLTGRAYKAESPTSRSCGARRARCSSGPRFPLAATTRRRCWRSSRPTRATSSSRSTDDALRPRDRDPRARRAPARAAVRAPRRVRALRLLPRLPAPRPLPHRQPAEDPGDPARRRSTGPARTSTCGSPSRCSCGCTSSSRRSPGDVPEFDVGEIEERIAEATRAWTDDLRDALRRGAGRSAASTLAALRDAFPPAYRADSRRAQAVRRHQRASRASTGRASSIVRLYRPDGDGRRCAAGSAGRAAAGALGRVPHARAHGRAGRATSTRTRSRRVDAPVTAIYAFGVRSGRAPPSSATTCARPSRTCSGARLTRPARERRLQPARAQRGPRVATSRSCCAPSRSYLRQAGMRSATTTSRDAARAPRRRGDARRAVRRPARSRARRRPRRAPRQLDARIVHAQIDAVASLDEDRILPLFLAVVRGDAAHQHCRRGRARRTWRSSSTLGDPAAARSRGRSSRSSSTRRASRACTCAAGDIARGGIRWSDRREDFRTEVLGLMKAQTVKNAVIVPVGAKGGFVRQAPAAAREAADEASLLPDVHPRPARRHRQPRRRRRIVPPPRRRAPRRRRSVPRRRGRQGHGDVLRRRQRRSPAEYGFWLGDAFASGGSAGYDHKEMGITARGAWESVQAPLPRARTSTSDTDGLHRRRHRRHVGRRVRQRDAAARRTSSSSAAFDHRHVFLDPDPDPAGVASPSGGACSSCRARRGPTTTARCSPRAAACTRARRSRSPLSRRRRGARSASTTRAAHARRADPRDPARAGRPAVERRDRHLREGVRPRRTPTSATAPTTRCASTPPSCACRVVGEGGNLGFTQRGAGRVRARRRPHQHRRDRQLGRRRHCSDHEVNIKILLRRRHRRPASLAADAARRAARRDDRRGRRAASSGSNERRRSRCRSRIEAPRTCSTCTRGSSAASRHAARLDRALEALPDAEVLANRRGAAHGLTQPELAVLLAYTKLELRDELRRLRRAGRSYLSRELPGAFPAPLPERYGDAMRAASAAPRDRRHPASPTGSSTAAGSATPCDCTTPSARRSRHRPARPRSRGRSMRSTRCGTTSRPLADEVAPDQLADVLLEARPPRGARDAVAAAEPPAARSTWRPTVEEFGEGPSGRWPGMLPAPVARGCAGNRPRERVAAWISHGVPRRAGPPCRADPRSRRGARRRRRGEGDGAPIGRAAGVYGGILGERLSLDWAARDRHGARAATTAGRSQARASLRDDLYPRAAGP